MESKLEQKLRELEAALQFFRRRLLNSQSLRSILIDLYNYLENEEEDIKYIPIDKKVKEGDRYKIEPLKK